MSSIAPSFPRPKVSPFSPVFERAGNRLFLSGGQERAAVDLRGFVVLTALGWVAMVAAAGLLYRSGLDHLYFVLGATSLIVGCAVCRLAHRRLTLQLERQCVALGMSPLGARQRAREIVFHLWTRGPRAPGSPLQQLLGDLFERGRSS